MMHSTRRFLSSSLNHHNRHAHSHMNMVLPPRSHWDTMHSAWCAIYNLFFYPSYRDTFVQNVDQKIIDPNILGQIDLGFFMCLALHHNLSGTSLSGNINNNNGNINSSSISDDAQTSRNYFTKYNFDPLEFINGSSVAVEHFQECLYSVDRKLMSSIEREIKLEVEKIEHGNDGSMSIDRSKSNDNDTDNDSFLDDNDELEQRKLMIERIVNRQMDELEARTAAAAAIADEENQNTKEETKSEGQSNDIDNDVDDRDEYNNEYALQLMTSKQLLDAIQKQFVASVIDCYTNDRMRMNYTLDSGKVLNVTLMSARAHEVPQEGMEEGSGEEGSTNLAKAEDKDGPMIDDSFLNDEEHDKHPVIAQLEVLYTISQSFTKKKIGCENGIDSAVEDNEDDDANNNDSDNKDYTMETAWVGVFEGWLDHRHQPLRWKLVDNRPAWEFPMMRR